MTVAIKESINAKKASKREASKRRQRKRPRVDDEG
jgi:hypothetical protein